MKITIEVIEGQSMVRQLEAVKEYIKDYGYKETGKDSGHKVEHSMGVNHVMFNKTKTGNYSAKVWLAV
jgi:hypothetical protein